MPSHRATPDADRLAQVLDDAGGQAVEIDHPDGRIGLHRRDHAGGLEPDARGMRHPAMRLARSIQLLTR